MDDLIAAGVFALTMMNLVYVGFRLRNDIRSRNPIFITLGIAAMVVALACVTVAGFIFWWEYTDVTIGW